MMMPGTPNRTRHAMTKIVMPRFRFQRLLVQGLFLVELRAFQKHLLQPLDLGAVGIVRRLAPRVMFAVDGDPLAGDNPGGHPQPGATEMPDGGMEI
jgi:hypothetical protein